MKRKLSWILVFSIVLQLITVTLLTVPANGTNYGGNFAVELEPVGASLSNASSNIATFGSYNQHIAEVNGVIYAAYHTKTFTNQGNSTQGHGKFIQSADGGITWTDMNLPAGLRTVNYSANPCLVSDGQRYVYFGGSTMNDLDMNGQGGRFMLTKFDTYTNSVVYWKYLPGDLNESRFTDGKFGMHYSNIHNALFIHGRDVAGSTQIVEVSPDGNSATTNKILNRRLTGALGYYNGYGEYFEGHYQSMSIDQDTGRIHMIYSVYRFYPSNQQIYEKLATLYQDYLMKEIRYIYSDDKGKTWKDAAGSILPTPYNADANYGTIIAKSVADDNDVPDYNKQDGMQVHDASILAFNNKVHILFHSYRAGLGITYVRLNHNGNGTYTEEKRHIFDYSVASMHASFVRDLQTNKIYISTELNQNTMAALESADGGDTWTVKGTIDRVPENDVYFSNTSMNVISSDGAVLMLTSDWGSDRHGQGVVFGKIFVSAPAGSHAITWYADGGTPYPEQSYVMNGGSINAPTQMSKAGYQFDGWYDNAQFSGSPVIFPVNGVTGARNFYAKWSPLNYNVTWTANGGSPAPTNGTVSHGGTISAPPDMNLTGYAFRGWYDNAQLSGNPVTFPMTNVTGNKNFYAKWTVKKDFYSITWNTNGGSPAPSTTSVAHGGSIAQPNGLTNNGLTLVGWYDNQLFSGRSVQFPVTNVMDDKVFYAKWLDTSNSIYYKLDGNLNDTYGGLPAVGSNIAYSVGGPNGTTYAALGVSDKIEVAPLNLESGLTFEAVVNIPQGTDGMILTGGVSGDNGFYVNVNPSGNTASLGFTVWGPGGLEWAYNFGIGEFALNTWTYIAVAWEAGTNEVTCYVMPLDAQSPVITTTALINGGTAPIMSGDIAMTVNGGTGSWTGLNGGVADVRITGSKLTESDLLINGGGDNGGNNGGNNGGVPPENSVYFRLNGNLNDTYGGLPAVGPNIAYSTGGPNGTTYAALGVSDKIEVAPMNLEAGLTFEAIVNIPQGTDGMILTGGVASDNGFYVNVNPSGNTASLGFTVWGPGGAEWAYSFGIGEFALNTWTYIAVAWEAGTNEVTCYVKPLDAQSPVITTTALINGGTAPIMSGNIAMTVNGGTGSWTGLNGGVEDVRITGSKLAEGNLLINGGGGNNGVIHPENSVYYRLNGNLNDTYGGLPAVGPNTAYSAGGPNGTTYAALGVSDKIEVAPMNLEAGLTFEAIVNIPQGTDGMILTGGVSGDNGFYVNVNPSGNTASLGFTVWGPGGAEWAYNFGIGEFALNTWTYIAVAWGAGTNEVTCYVKPLDAQSPVITTTALINGGTAPIMSGNIAMTVNGGTGSWTGLNGGVEDVRITGSKLAEGNLLINGGGGNNGVIHPENSVYYRLNGNLNDTYGGLPAVGPNTAYSTGGPNGTTYAALGVSDKIEVAPMNLEAGLTFEAIVNIPQGTDGMILTGGVSGDNGFYVNVNPSGNTASLGFTVWGPGGLEWAYNFGIGEFALNTWTYIAVAWGAGTNEVTCYVRPLDAQNPVITTTALINGGTAPIMSGNIAMTVNGGTGSWTGLNGGVADVRITGSKLTEGNLLINDVSIADESFGVRLDYTDVDNNIPTFGAFNQHLVEINGVYYATYLHDPNGSNASGNVAYGRIIKSTDGGKTWTNIYTPKQSYWQPPVLVADKYGNLYIGGFGPDGGYESTFHLTKYSTATNSILYEKYITGTNFSTKFGMQYSPYHDCLYINGRDAHSGSAIFAEVDLDGNVVHRPGAYYGTNNPTNFWWYTDSPDYSGKNYYQNINYTVLDAWGRETDISNPGTGRREAHYSTIYVDENTGRIHYLFTVYNFITETNYQMLEVRYLYSDDQGVTWRDATGTAMSNSPRYCTDGYGTLIAKSQQLGGLDGDQTHGVSILVANNSVHIMVHAEHGVGQSYYRLDPLTPTTYYVNPKQSLNSMITQMHAVLIVDPVTGYLYISSESGSGYTTRPIALESKNNGNTWSVKGALPDFAPQKEYFFSNTAWQKVTSDGSIIALSSDFSNSNRNDMGVVFTKIFVRD